MARRDYAGGAATTTISTGINATDLTIILSSSSGWPVGTNGPFFVSIDVGLSTEEKILVTSRSGTTLTVASTGDRGVDGTIAQTHSASAPIIHCGTATDLDEGNAHINDPTRNDHTQYYMKTVAEGAGLVANGDAIDVHVDNSTVEVNADVLRVKDAGVTSAKLASNAVTTAKITDANVTSAKLAANAVVTSQITDANVTTAKIADSAVTSAKIADGTIATADLANSAVTSAKVDSTVAATTYVDTADKARAKFPNATTPVLVGTSQNFSTTQGLVQCGSTVVTTDSGGNGTINFPTAFPTGLVMVVATWGDVGGAGAPIWTANYTAALFQFHATVTLSNVRVNWIAVGY